MNRDNKNHILDWARLVALMAAAPLFLFPKPEYWPVFLLIPISAIIGLSRKKQSLSTTPLDVPVFIILIAVFVSTLRVTDFSHNLPKIIGLLYAIAIFYAAVSLLKTKKLLKSAAALFLAGAFFFSLVGLLGMPTFKGKHLGILMKIKDMIPRLDFKLPGAESGFATNAVAGTLLLVIPLFLTLAVACFKNKGPRINRVLLSVGLAVTGFVLLLTQSRGAWGGLFIAVVTIGLVFSFKIIKRKKIAIIVLTSLLFLSIVSGAGLFWMSHSGQLVPGMKQAEGTLLFRIQLWDLTIPVIAANPVWGIGLNNFRLIPEVRYFLSHPHNQLFYVAVELGIPALIAYIALLGLLGGMCVEVWRKSTDTWMRYACLGLGWGQIAFFFFGMTDAIPLGAKVGIIFWLSAALITAIYLKTYNPNER